MSNAPPVSFEYSIEVASRSYSSREIRIGAWAAVALTRDSSLSGL
jgi:hypothetical protein